MVSVLADWAAVVGVPLALIALLYTTLQLRNRVRVDRATFQLELERMIQTHDTVHTKLRPGGEWSSQDSGPDTKEEWAKVEEYMGFFEHSELLIRAGVLQEEVFEVIFGYRLDNILHNRLIVIEKLIGRRRKYWELFIALCRRLGRDV